MKTLFLLLIFSLHLGASSSFASTHEPCCEKFKGSIFTKKTIIFIVAAGSAVYFHKDIVKFAENNFTAESREKLRDFAMDEILRPVANTVATEGPRILREHITVLILGRIVGILSSS